MIPRVRVNYRFADVARALVAPSREGAKSRTLERRVADFAGAREAILTASGRGGLYLVLKAIGRAKAVMPAYTCKAVAEAAILAGCEPVHIDIEGDGYDMSMAHLELRVDADCVIVATHQYGAPAPIRRLQRLCNERGAVLIEDAAAAFGSCVDGRQVGAAGRAGVFSFDSTKTIHAPLKGGAIVTNDPGLAGRVRALMADETSPPSIADKFRWLGGALAYQALANPVVYRAFHHAWFAARGRRYSETPGLDPRKTAFHSRRLADWQAGIVFSQLDRFDEIRDRRRALYSLYHKALKGAPGIQLPPEDRSGEWCCTRFAVRIDVGRDAVADRMAAAGVDLAYSFAEIGAPADCVNAHRLARGVVNMPFYPQLSDAAARRAADALLQAVEDVAALDGAQHGQGTV